MTKNEVAEALAILRVAYPHAYKADDDIELIIGVWERAFIDEEAGVVAIAIENIIKTSEYPPSIAMVKNHIERLKQYATNSDTPAELWEKLVYACSHSSESGVFDKLPRVLQLFVGNARQLCRYGSMELTDLEKYIRPELNKELPSLRERVKFENETSPEQKRLLAEAVNNKLSAAKATNALPSR